MRNAAGCNFVSRTPRRRRPQAAGSPPCLHAPATALPVYHGPGMPSSWVQVAAARRQHQQQRGAARCHHFTGEALATSGGRLWSWSKTIGARSGGRAGGAQRGAGQNATVPSTAVHKTANSTARERFVTFMACSPPGAEDGSAWVGPSGSERCLRSVLDHQSLPHALRLPTA